MPEEPVTCSPTDPVARIVTLRGQKVILDSDLAAIYGVETKRLNEQVKRNADRFPSDFMFQLTPDELDALISQDAISSAQPAANHEDKNWSQSATGSERGMRSQIATASKRNVRFLPYAFTEHGAPSWRSPFLTVRRPFK